MDNNQENKDIKKNENDKNEENIDKKPVEDFSKYDVLNLIIDEPKNL